MICVFPRITCCISFPGLHLELGLSRSANKFKTQTSDEVVKREREEARGFFRFLMEILVTLVMVVLGLGLLWAVKILGSTVAGRTRARGASRSQARRHFVNAAQLLAKSRSPGNAGAVGRKIAREAVAEADAAILLDPKDAALHIVKSLALQQLGRPAAALRSLTTALTKPASRSLSPSERAEALAKRASLFLEQGKGRRGLDLAIADLEESLSLKADNVDVQCMLASCYEKNGQKVKAVAAYQKSLALDPDFSEAKKGLSKVE